MIPQFSLKTHSKVPLSWVWSYFQAGPTPSQIKHPLTAQQKVAVMRNIERMLGEALGDHRQVDISINI